MHFAISKQKPFVHRNAIAMSSRKQTETTKVGVGPYGAYSIKKERRNTPLSVSALLKLDFNESEIYGLLD